jgi:hypothetical protein
MNANSAIFEFQTNKDLNKKNSKLGFLRESTSKNG